MWYLRPNPTQLKFIPEELRSARKVRWPVGYSEMAGKRDGEISVIRLVGRERRVSESRKVRWPVGYSEVAGNRRW